MILNHKKTTTERLFSLIKKGFAPAVLSGLLFLTSCQKVIDLDLNSTEKKYVIEAVVTDQTDSSKILISQTKNFNENNTFPGVSGALITVTDNTGAIANFTESSAGVYTSKGFKGTVGRTYTLKVTVAGNNFTAVSAIPQKVNLDSAFVTGEFLFGENRNLINVLYKEPAGRGNNYRFVQYINGVKDKAIFVGNDDYNDGKAVEDKLFYITDDDEESRKIKSGDLIWVEMLCIAAPVYKYWFSLDQSATGTNQSASPANPVTNMQGGALGYFSAHTYQKKSFLVP